MPTRRPEPGEILGSTQGTINRLRAELETARTALRVALADLERVRDELVTERRERMRVEGLLAARGVRT